MFRFKSILVPVDLSTSAKAAYALANSLRAEERPLLHLAHAVAPMSTYARDVLFPYAPLGEDDVEFEHEMLEAARERICAEYEIDLENLANHLAEPRIELGAPRELLPEFTRTAGSDLVVMGAFGESGVYPDALGSLAERTIRTARQPVLLTRDYDPSPTIDRITVATDLTRASDRVLEAAVAMALACDATIEVVYVIPDPATLDTNNVLRMLARVNEKEALKKTKSRVEALFDRLHDTIDAPMTLADDVERLVGRRRTLFGDPVREVLNRAERVHSDLIVVGTQKADRAGRTRLGSIAQAIAHRATTHVMVVPVDPTLALGEED